MEPNKWNVQGSSVTQFDFLVDFYLYQWLTPLFWNRSSNSKEKNVKFTSTKVLWLDTASKIWFLKHLFNGKWFGKCFTWGLTVWPLCPLHTTTGFDQQFTHPIPWRQETGLKTTLSECSFHGFAALDIFAAESSKGWVLEKHLAPRWNKIPSFHKFDYRFIALHKSWPISESGHCGIVGMNHAAFCQQKLALRSFDNLRSCSLQTAMREKTWPVSYAENRQFHCLALAR